MGKIITLEPNDSGLKITFEACDGKTYANRFNLTATKEQILDVLVELDTNIAKAVNLAASIGVDTVFVPKMTLTKEAETLVESMKPKKIIVEEPPVEEPPVVTTSVISTSIIETPV